MSGWVTLCRSDGLGDAPGPLYMREREGNDVDQCPFCQAEVKADLIIYGGTCPSCFGEIPGEEAATDPGEEVKAAQARSDNRRATWRVFAPLLLATPLVGCMGVAAVVFLLWPNPEVREIIDFDSAQYGLSLDEMVAAVPKEKPALVAKVEPEPSKGSGKAGTEKKGSSVTDNPLLSAGKGYDASAQGIQQIGGTGDGVADLGSDGPKRQSSGSLDGPQGTAELSVGYQAPTSGGLSTSSIMDVGRKKAPLEDQAAIAKMIGLMMTAQSPQLKACYESRLKQNEALEGRWRIVFTVSANGTVSGAQAEGMNVQDTEFESCMQSKVLKWRFDPIIADQPVQKSWNFRPT